MSPEIRITAYLFIIISLFFTGDLTVYLLFCILLLIFLMRIPVQTLKRGWIPISLLLFFTFIGNMLFQQGRILFSSGLIVVTQEGLHTAAVRTMRVFIMIAGAKIIMASSKPEVLTEALRRMLKPLERLRVPVDEFFQIMELTMKSLPVLKEQTVCLYKERVNHEPGNGYLGRIRTVSSLLIPMFVKSIQSPESIFREDSGQGTITGPDGEKRGEMRKDKPA